MRVWMTATAMIAFLGPRQCRPWYVRMTPDSGCGRCDAANWRYGPKNETANAVAALRAGDTWLTAREGKSLFDDRGSQAMMIAMSISSLITIANKTICSIA
jgi:hypothetical protein